MPHTRSLGKALPSKRTQKTRKSRVFRPSTADKQPPGEISYVRLRQSGATQQLQQTEQQHADKCQQAPFGDAQREQGPADLGTVGTAMQNHAHHFLKRQRIHQVI